MKNIEPATEEEQLQAIARQLARFFYGRFTETEKESSEK
jgi:hypothetical protein